MELEPWLKVWSSLLTAEFVTHDCVPFFWEDARPQSLFLAVEVKLDLDYIFFAQVFILVLIATVLKIIQGLVLRGGAGEIHVFRLIDCLFDYLFQFIFFKINSLVNT